MMGGTLIRIKRGIRLGGVTAIDLGFAILRVLTVIGGAIWVYFWPQWGEHAGGVKYLFGGFFLYSTMLFLLLVRNQALSKAIYRASLVLDLLFITGLVVLTGGVKSNFYLAYYLLVALHTFYYSSLKTGVYTAVAAAALYLGGNWGHLGEIYWGDLALRVIFLGLVGLSTGFLTNELTKAYRQLSEYAKQIEEANRALDVRLNRMTSLYEASRMLGSAIQYEEILSIIVEIACELTSAPIGYLLVAEGDELKFKVWRGLDDEAVREIRVPKGEGVVGQVFSSAQPKIVDDLFALPDSAHPDLDQKANLRSVVAVPLISGGAVVGVLNVSRPVPKSFTSEDLQLLTVIASLATAAIEKAQIYEQSQRLAITDGLTGLFNYRYFVQQIDHEVKRSLRYGSYLSVIMFDLDYFKKINDTYGHPQGDVVLKQVAQIMKVNTRESDLAARYGGEEFALILPETSGQAARVVAERIRLQVAASSFPGPEGLMLKNVTVSAGVATFNGNETPEGLVQRADKALYQAKINGRNQTYLA